MVYTTLSGTHWVTPPDACLLNKYAFNLFFTKGIVAHKSELGVDPNIITYSSPRKHVSTFFSNIKPTSLFHTELALKTKFLFEISKSTSGRCKIKFVSLWLFLNK